MRKFSKVMLVFICIFAAVGIGMTAGGLAMGASLEGEGALQQLRDHYQDAWNFFSDEQDYEESDATGDDRVFHFDDIEKMDVELKSEKLIFTNYEGKDLMVTVNNDSNEKIEVQKQSKVLSIQGDSRTNKRTVTISYPSDWSFDEVDLSVGAGVIDIQKILRAKQLSIDLGFGELVSEGEIITDETDIETGAGSVQIDSLTANLIDGECGLGALTLQLEGKEQDYNYQLECGVGQITIGDQKYSGLGKEKDITNPGADKEMSLECGMGEISVGFSQ